MLGYILAVGREWNQYLHIYKFNVQIYTKYKLCKTLNSVSTITWVKKKYIKKKSPLEYSIILTMGTIQCDLLCQTAKNGFVKSVKEVQNSSLLKFNFDV